MYCPNCAMTLEGLEDELNGIQQISVSYRKQILEAEYDEKKVEVEEIIQAAGQKGYTLIPT